MIHTNTDMLFFRRKLPNCFRRIAFSQKMNGVLLGFNRVVGGFTMRSTAQNHTSCSLGGN